MPRYEVEVEYTQRKVITVWAPDEMEAEDKATGIVEGWNGVTSAEAIDVQEIEG